MIRLVPARIEKNWRIIFYVRNKKSYVWRNDFPFISENRKRARSQEWRFEGIWRRKREPTKLIA
ncbi:unnamed protein product, partial [Vitis vinifera]